MLYYLPIVGRLIAGCITFLRVLALCEMQTAPSRFLTRVGIAISDDVNHTFILTCLEAIDQGFRNKGGVSI